MSSKKPHKSTTEAPDDHRLSRGRARPDAIFPVAPSISAQLVLHEKLRRVLS